jgi:hypothetical protein
VLAVHVNGAVGPAGQRLAQHLRDARGPGGHGNDFAAVFLTQPQRLFERVGVGLVQLPAGVAVPDPGFRLVDAHLPLARHHLLDTDGDLHSYLFIRRVPLVPPNPKEFESA